MLTSCVLLIMVRMRSLDAVTYSTRSITHLRIDALSIPFFFLVWAHGDAHETCNNVHTHTPHTHIRACFMRDKRSTNVLACVLKVLVCFVLYYMASPPKCFFIVASTFPPSPLLARCWQVPSCRLNSQRGLCDIYSVLCLFIHWLPHSHLCITNKHICFAARQGCFYHQCTVNCDCMLIMQTSF